MLLLFWIYIIDPRRKGEARSIRHDRVGAVIILTSMILGIVNPQSIYLQVFPNEVTGFVMSAIFICCLSSFFLTDNGRTQKTLEHEKTIGLPEFNFLIVFALVVPFLGFAVSQEMRNEAIGLAAGVVNQLGFGGVVFTFVMAHHSFALNETESQIWPHVDYSEKKASAQIICVFLLTMAIANSMTAGFTAEAWFISVGLLVSYISWKMSQSVKRGSARVLLALALVPIISVFSIRIVGEPYSWWALREPAIETDRYSIPTIALSGFRVNKSQRDVWIRITRAVSEITTAPIFAGPNIGGVPLLIDRKSTFNNCPIIWWDVCPENKALADFEWLKRTKPIYIVWSHQPEFVIYGHEQAFRQGKKSAVSMMQEWIDEQVGNGTYLLKDKISDSSSSYVVVLKLNEKSP